MGGCCGSESEEQSNTKFGDGSNDLSDGPAKNRGCTDAWCLIVFVASWVGFVAVSAMGLAQGDLAKLYMPRDYQGAYCDVEKNWNNGPNLLGMTKQSYMMNVSSVVDEISKQIVCSAAVEDIVRNGAIFTGVNATADLNTYLAECCLVPSDKCDAAIETPTPITGAGGMAVIGQRMGQLTGGTGADLANPSSINGDKFATMFEEASKFFTPVCVKSCDLNMEALTATAVAEQRNYVYSPAMDNPLRKTWDALESATAVSPPDNTRQASLDAVKVQLSSAFAFKAFPTSVCNYHPSKCVPMPGMDYMEITEGSGYCTFKMAAAAAGAVGEAAAGAMASIGMGNLAEGSTDGIGEMMGNLLASLDTIIVVAVLTFAIGLVFLVILRFTVGLCVWIAVILTCLMFPLSGALAYVKSGQCQGATLFESGAQVSSAVAVAAQSAATSTGMSEAMDVNGTGSDYKGGQYKSISGKTCKAWDQTMYSGNTAWSATTFNNGVTLTDANGATNYCRNPYQNEDVNKARTIWCFTTDTAVNWEVCAPIGVIQPVCAKGYAIEGEQMRGMLKGLAYVLWAVSLIWVLLIFCFIGRIKLAIALNKAAAEFLAANPLVLLVPIVQSIVGIIWILVWCFLAAYLLSQVPDDYMDTGAYATFGEAYGIDGAGWLDSGIPGKCTDKWPTGGVYKADECLTEGDVVKCWKCFPPRYVFDQYFAYSWFCFLWNNAFNIALGQAVIAMCVCTWFFADKEGGRPSIVKASFWTICRNHLGSIAFGSFIIALIQFIRSVMKYLEKQAEAQKNKVMVYVFKIIGCCIWVFEKCMKFLNKNAYIQMALMGTNFCTSAKKAFFLIMRNALRFGTVAVLGQVVHYIGCFCITIASIFVGYLLLGVMHPDIPPLAPILCFSAIGYVVSELYMSVFGMATDTCLQCFIACEEMGGHPNAPSILNSILTPAPKGESEADQA
jgi:hypothetical protein